MNKKNSTSLKVEKSLILVVRKDNKMETNNTVQMFEEWERFLCMSERES